MKAVKVFAILLAMIFVIIWIRGGEHFDIRRILPLVNEKPGLYQGGGIAMFALLLWNLSRLRQARSPVDDDSRRSRNAIMDPDEDS